MVHFDLSGHFDRSVRNVPSTALLYPAYKNNNQTRGGLGWVCATGMYRFFGHVEISPLLAPCRRGDASSTFYLFRNLVPRVFSFSIGEREDPGDEVVFSRLPLHATQKVIVRDWGQGSCIEGLVTWVLHHAEEGRAVVLVKWRETNCLTVSI